MRKILYFVLAFVSWGLYSCTNEASQNNPIEKQSLNQDSINIQLSKFADSLELKISEYQDLLEENAKQDIRMEMMYRKLHILQNENDSLRYEIDQLNEEKKILNKPTEADEVVISDSEKGIRGLVHDMNASWRTISKTKKPKNILKYFLPKFIVHRIAIETDNEATVAIYTNDDFAEYIREVARHKGHTLEYGDVKFYDIEIKNDVYFKVAYKCELRIYDGDKLESKNSMLITIAGKHIEDQWKIASYSEVSFKYDN